jgi:hypothetical protein
VGSKPGRPQPPARECAAARRAVRKVQDPRARAWLLRLLARGERSAAPPAPAADGRPTLAEGGRP